MLQSSNIPPLYNYNNGTWDSRAIYEQRLLIVWASHKINQWQGPSIHIPLWKSALLKTRDTAKPVLCIPPSNWWNIRMKESMGRTISLTSHISSPWRLDAMANNSFCSSQQSGKCNNQISPKSDPPRIWDHPHSIRNTTIKQQDSPGMIRTSDKKTGTSHWCNKQNSKITQGDTTPIPPRGPGMARGNSPQTPPSEDEACPKTIWPLSNHKRNLLCGISAETPCLMGDPQCVPCIPLITLSRDDCTWP